MKKFMRNYIKQYFTYFLMKLVFFAILQFTSILRLNFLSLVRDNRFGHVNF